MEILDIAPIWLFFIGMVNEPMTLRLPLTSSAILGGNALAIVKKQ